MKDQTRSPARIFIGGTGRSGTSILYETLGCNQSIYKFPKEMRFIVDPDGLMDLINVLTRDFSPTQAREGLYKFERLMRLYLTVPEAKPYRQFDFATWLGGDYYWQRLDEFCDALTELEFQGSDWPVKPMAWKEGRLVHLAKRVTDLRRHIKGQPTEPPRLTMPQAPLKVARYFSDRQKLMQLGADFVDDVFLYAARQAGKETWCEKTPNNLLHIDFLWELFPNSVFIHMKRDPRGVVHSMVRRSWVPHDIKGVCIFLQNVYDRWFDLQRTVNFGEDRFLEVKLEEFAAEPNAVLAEISACVGVANRFDELPKISSEKVDYWRNTMDPEDITLVSTLLARYIKQMGYEL